MTVVKEANQDFVNDIAELRSTQTRTGKSVQSDDFADPWFATPAPAKEPLSWDVARQLFGQGKAVSLVLSFDPGATVDDHDLVLWRWDESPSYQVRASDRSKRLPKGQL